MKGIDNVLNRGRDLDYSIMGRDATHTRRVMAVNAALLLLALSCAVLFFWRWVNQGEATRDFKQSQADVPEVGRVNAHTVSVDGAAGSLPGDVGTPGTPGEAGAAGQDLILRFAELTASGLIPVPGLRVNVTIPEVDARRRLELITDEGGRARLRGPVGANAEVSLYEDQWRFVSRRRAGTSSITVPVLLHGPSGEVSLAVERVRTHVLEIRYADGVDYAGVITLRPGFGAPTQVEIAPGPAKLVLPAEGRFDVLVAARRPGFADRVVALDPPAAGTVQVITLDSADREHGVLEVVCLGSVPGMAVDITIEETSAHESARRQLQSDRVRRWSAEKAYVSRSLREGDFLVIVRPSQGQGALVGRAEARVVRGAAVQVQIVLTMQATVRARFVLADGNPVPRARLVPAEAEHVHWDWLAGLPAGYARGGDDPIALADSDGVAVLSGLIPGVVRLLGDARGYGQQRFDVTLAQGECHDLGTVVLAEAEGRIVIHVDHPEADDNSEYEVMLLKPLAGVVFGPASYTGKQFVIERLPLLTYTVSIRYVGGGFGATSRQVALTADKPEGSVTFKMARPVD